jgi:carbon-monoxide dehydrogenase medium subunit
VPKRPDWVGHYLKFNRVAQAWATVGVAASLQRDNGTITQTRVALTNMGPTPVRARAVEGALTGVPASRSAIRSAAMLAGEGTRPTSDVSASAEYRLHLAQVLTARAVAAAAAAAEG